MLPQHWRSPQRRSGDLVRHEVSSRIRCPACSRMVNSHEEAPGFELPTVEQIVFCMGWSCDDALHLKLISHLQLALLKEPWLQEVTQSHMTGARGFKVEIPG